MNEDAPLKFGVQFDPPVIIYVFRDGVTKKKNRYTLPLDNYDVNCDIAAVSVDIKLQHERLRQVPLETIKRILRALRRRWMGADVPGAINRKMYHVGPKIPIPSHSPHLIVNHVPSPATRHRNRDSDSDYVTDDDFEE